MSTAAPASMDAAAAAQRAAGNEKVLEGQKRALELAVHGAPLHDVLDALARTVEAQSSQGVLASVLLLEEKAGRLRHGAAPSLPAEYNAAIDGIAIGPTVGSCGTAAHSGAKVVVRDIEHDPLWANFKDLALRHGLRACWSTPIFSSRHRVLGTFALYHRFPTVPTERDEEIVELLAHTAGLVIEREQIARERADADAQQMARVSAMFEHAPAAIAVLRGPTFIFETTNAGYRELVSGRECLGKTVAEALPEVGPQGFIALLEDVYRTGTPYVGRSTRVVLDGPDGPRERYFDFVYQPIPGPQGKTESILVVAFEVTELALSRLAAQESERALRTFIDNLPELAWTAQPDGHIDYYNRRWYEYTGTTFEEMQGWGWEKVHDPELLPKVKERWKHSLATGEPFEMEFTLRGSDGVPRWFLTRVAPQRDATGKIVRWFGTNTNIDDMKSAHALSQAMTQQSLDMQRALLELRSAKESAERRIAELEAALRAKR